MKKFTGTSRDYVTKEAVVQVNARLMNKTTAGDTKSKPFESHNLRRPSREEIEKAGSNALRAAASF